VQVSQPQEQIIIEINKEEDLNKISALQLNLVLPRSKHKVSKHNKVSKTEPLLVYELAAKAQEITPMKEATVEVNSVTVALIKQKVMVQREQ